MAEIRSTKTGLLVTLTRWSQCLTFGPTTDFFNHRYGHRIPSTIIMNAVMYCKALPLINPVFTVIIKLIGTLRKNTDDIDEDSQDTDQKDSAAGARVCTSIGMCVF